MGRNRKKKHQQSSLCADTTITDYADAPIDSEGRIRRLPKGGNGIAVATVKQDLVVDDISEPSWFEKKLSDFDDFDGQDSAALLESTRSLANNLDAEERPGQRRKRRQKSERFAAGAVYPQDLWCLLADYVHPESVAQFAGICTHAYYAIKTASFWIKLYRRFYRKDFELPSSLKPENLCCRYGLKARVIRALFYFYQPFVDKAKLSAAPSLTEPHALKGRRCALMWHARASSQWTFYFKFRHPSVVVCNRRDILNCTDEVNANSEDGSSVMIVMCNNFMSVPVVMGQTLTHVCFNVSRDMRYQRLKLVFHPIYHKGTANNPHTGTTVLLDPVISVKILYWWHPLYDFGSP